MKKIIGIIVLSFLMFSCEPQVYDYAKSGNIVIVEFDNCEYIFCHATSGWGITHKGNCKYCAERAKNNKP